MVEKKNPIPFNTETMTVSQLKEVADNMRTIFASVDRGVNAEDLVGHIESLRDFWIRKWEVK